MNETTKKLAEALERIKTAYGSTDFDYQMSEYMQETGLKMIDKVLSEYREQEKKPKTELVELDFIKLLQVFEENKDMPYVPLCRVIHETFGTKRVSVENTLDALKKTDLSHNCGCCASEPDEYDAKAIHKLIYGNEK
jgi:hypothetical protein